MPQPLTPGLTIYVRNPEKNYAFEKTGQIVFFGKHVKSIMINGELYTLTQEGSE